MYELYYWREAASNPCLGYWWLVAKFTRKQRAEAILTAGNAALTRDVRLVCPNGTTMHNYELKTY